MNDGIAKSAAAGCRTDLRMVAKAGEPSGVFDHVFTAAEFEKPSSSFDLAPLIAFAVAPFLIYLTMRGIGWGAGGCVPDEDLATTTR